MIREIKQNAEGAKAYSRHKKFGVLQSIFLIFFWFQSNKNDQTVVSTLHHVTIISNKFLKPNGIKNWEVPYLQKLSWEEKVEKSQVVLKLELKDVRIKCHK